MKSSLLIPASALLLGALTALPAADSAPAVPIPAAAPARKYTDAELLEMLGWLAGNSTQLSQFNFTEAELAAVTKGFASASSGKEAPFKQDDIQEQFSKYMEDKVTVARKAMADKQAEQSKKNTADGEKFLADKKTQKGVVTLPSGLLYEITQPGTGAFPKATNTVRVIYTGMLVDGTVFDATSKHADDAASQAAGKFVASKWDEFPLDQVIPAWTEGIQKINKGGKLKLYVPANLAYGDKGSPPVIQPGSTLVFEVELIDIK
ncbi:MAG: FKBP-type peptidyl-prolyl cis-trans isomerase [Verrucomicrobiota bacterium]